MKTFDELKDEVRTSTGTGPAAQSEYGRFLDLLVVPANDRRSKDARWDLWFFSDNTDFCLASSQSFLEKLKGQSLELQRLLKELELQKLPEERESQCSWNVARQHFGCFSFYLYAALESFAQEANILYGFEIRPGLKLSISGVLERLKGSEKEWELKKHLDIYLKDPAVEDFREYRDAIMHGYVFFMSGDKRGFFVEQKPKAKWIGSKALMDRPIDQFCQTAYEKVHELIRIGWRCFGKDQLS